MRLLAFDPRLSRAGTSAILHHQTRIGSQKVTESSMAAQQFPEPTVGAFIFNPAGKLFLMRSHKWHGRYVVPGGHVELGETLEQALLREVREETGMIVTEPRLICTQECIYDPAFWKPRHFIFFDYACRNEAAPDSVQLNDEAEDYTWTTVEEALRLPIDAYTDRVLREYQRQTQE
jgi:nucleoside triphosphatase